MNIDPYAIGAASVATIALVTINAILVACESSLVRLRYRLAERPKLEHLQRLRPVAFLTKRLSTAAPLVRFGIMASTSAAGIIGFSLLRTLVGATGFTLASMPLSLLLLALTISMISLFGYLIPRGLALHRPDKTLVATAWFVAVFVMAMLPWFRLQRLIARKTFSLFRMQFREDFNIVDFEVQVQAIAGEDTHITPRMLAIMRNTLQMGELDVSAVLLPRNQVRYFDLDHSIEENLNMARETGHTRFPLCRGDLDQCVGIIHIKDLFRANLPADKTNLMAMRREIFSFTEETPLEETLQQMLSAKVHMALVRDEFGGVLGVVTLEGIIEQLIGEIEDEFDVESEETIRTIGSSEFEVPGLTPLHEIEGTLCVEIENPDVSTFGGLVTAEIGRIPRTGESIQIESPALEVTVTEADETRIISTRVRVLNN